MLELKDISFQVNDETADKEILKNINLKIEDRFVAITGPNGGGKSTLAKLIAGIVTPTSGQILLDGEDITGLSITERARKGISIDRKGLDYTGIGKRYFHQPGMFLSFRSRTLRKGLYWQGGK